MKTILFLVYLTAVSPRVHERESMLSFLRNDVEKVTNYPFKTPPLPVGRKNSDIRDLQFSNQLDRKKSAFLNYVLENYGSKNLPIREAVESLPYPLLTSEKR